MDDKMKANTTKLVRDIILKNPEVCQGFLAECIFGNPKQLRELLCRTSCKRIILRQARAVILPAILLPVCISGNTIDTLEVAKKWARKE